jgi:hypothetical protein
VGFLGRIKMKIVMSVAIVVLVLSSISFANLTQVDLISQTHTVSGYVENPSGDPAYFDYYEDADHPISGSISIPEIGTASSYTEDLHIHASTNGGSYSYGANASIHYIFRPLSNLLDFSLTQSCSWSGSPADSTFSCYLKDMDTDTFLTYFTGNGDFIAAHESPLGSHFELFENQTQFSVFTEHQYILAMNIHADAFDGTTVDLIVDLVPEPTTVLMLIVGSCLVRFRKLSAAN